jgi:hypothetical protein
LTGFMFRFIVQTYEHLSVSPVVLFVFDRFHVYIYCTERCKFSVFRNQLFVILTCII